MRDARFFGELYLKSTRPFLPAWVTETEIAYLEARLAEVTIEGPVLDVGCGHGRHLAGLSELPRLVVGLDFDPLSLSEARASGAVVRGDFFSPPFRDGAFAAAFAWYNTLFTFEDALLPSLLQGLARSLKPGGLLLIQSTNLARAQAEPTAHYDGQLPDGGRLVEDCTFDYARRRDEVTRTLTLPDGRVMAASFFIRYYGLDELSALLHEAGLEVEWVHGGVDAGALQQTSQDQIVGAHKRA